MIWQDPQTPPEKAAEALVAAVRSRKDLKRLGAWLDTAPRGVREALIARAAKHGVELPEDAVDWPGKRLLRRAQAREPASRVRTNPIARDEDFVCMRCGKEVPAHGRTARDHCPWCLRGRHVDVVPGDRASDCGGRLDPYGVDVNGREVVILYQCTRCRAERTNRAVLDGDVPDDWEALVRLSSGKLG